MKRLLTRLTIFPILSSIVSMLLFAACHDPHTSEILTRADGLMESAPDSAYSLLRGIDSTRLRRADAPLYAILDAQARHKLDLTPPSDSLLDIAVEHYTAHGPDSLLMKALFYRAVGKYQTYRLPEAVKDATASWEIAESSARHYWMAKSADLIADLFYDSFNFTEESEWRALAARNYQTSEQNINYMCCLIELATSYTNCHDSLRSHVILDSIKRETTRNDYPQPILDSNIPNEVYYYLNFSGLEKVDSILDQPRMSEILNEEPSLYLAKARSLMAKGQYEECRLLLDSISTIPAFENEGTLLLHAYYDLAIKTRDVLRLPVYTDSLLKLQLADVNRAISYPVAIAQPDYFHSSSKRQEQRNREIRRFGIILICLITGIAVICVVVYKLRLIKKDQQLREKVKASIVMSGMVEQERRVASEAQSEIRKLKSELETATDRYVAVNEKLKETFDLIPEIYKTRWEALEILCKSARNMEELPPATVVKEIATAIDKFKSKSFIHDVEKQLNRDFNNIILRLREDCPTLKKEDFPICILSFAGIGCPAIAMILDIPLPTLYVKRQRIRSRIQRNKCPNLELYISKVSG